MSQRAPHLRSALLGVIEALFRVLFSYDCAGEEKIPASGGVVVAANHPSYLDPVLLSLQVRRPIRFMAWEGLFRVPLLGPVIRAFGAFPVNTGRGKGRDAYDKARGLVQAGEVVGIFPEGKRSRTGWMEESLRLGVARLAWETGAPLVPGTITGAFRAWPHHQALPKPASIRVRFHDPIDPGRYRALPEQEALPAMIAELRQRVERSLLPGVKADLRRNVLYRLPAPPPRLHELLPPVLLGLAVLWKSRSPLFLLPVGGYLLYLFSDRFLIPQSRLAKWIRNASPILFALGYVPLALRGLGLDPVPAGAALASITLAASFPYLYERQRTALDFVRGMTAAAYLELVVLWSVRDGLGAHVALPLFAAAFAWERGSVFWRYAAPVLLGYAVGVPLFLSATPELMPHALAGLLAWLAVRVFPYDRAAPAAGTPAVRGLGLRL